MSVRDNISVIKESIAKGVTLVAVSKTKPNELIMEAYEAGQRIFGENKVQELSKKAEELPKDIEWHFIGHLQTNKVKYIAPYVDLLHGVDSMKLIKTIDKEAQKNNRNIRCLLQFHIAEETSKFGLDLDEAKEILNSEEYQSLNNISIVGVMGMATYTEDQKQIKSEFSSLKGIFMELKRTHFANLDQFKEISMGMSSDYTLAIEEGSTMVRVGSSIFGNRVYP